MNSFDAAILEFVNSAAQKSRFFDLVVGHISWNNLLKSGLILSFFWWAWFKDDRNGGAPTTAREHILATLVGAIVSVGFARAFAQLLPFRQRPFLVTELHWVPPFKSEGTLALEKWSAFPSDHAALLFSLSFGLLFISRRLGIFAMLYTLVVVCLPRIYLGVHAPTDLLAGGALGVGVAWIFNANGNRQRISTPALKLLQQSPGVFYAGMFLLTYQTADMFEHLRAILSATSKAMSGLSGG